MKILTQSMIGVLVYSLSASLFASSPSTVKCPNKRVPAVIDITVEISTNLKCPLLEDKKSKKLIKTFMFGSIFAYPKIPGTCVSGDNLTGTILLKGKKIQVHGYTESAQQLFPEAKRVGDSLLISGVSNKTGELFVSGAATTLISLSGIYENFEAKLLMFDRFTIDFSSWPIINTEDFFVIGSKGNLKKATGRLLGVAEITSPPPAPQDRVPFRVTGTICVK